MVFNFKEEETPFVPKEGGIFSPQPPMSPLGLQEGETDPLPIINASGVPTATWVVPGQVDTIVSKEGPHKK
ncbi:MAG: hypothetical protein PHY14_00075 [Candidatus Gracilibacteria bacterium]|nr:hypothetical protein [Candidatus Gracilibacteria bacterium]